MINFDIAKTWHKIFAEKLEYAAMGCPPESTAMGGFRHQTSDFYL
jgi:hypothetical protein